MLSFVPRIGICSMITNGCTQHIRSNSMSKSDGFHPVMLVWLVTATLVGAMVGLTIAPTVLQPTTPQSCHAALTAADARHALAESTTALTEDAWHADTHDDQHALEAAQAGIHQNSIDM